MGLVRSTLWFEVQYGLVLPSLVWPSASLSLVHIYMYYRSWPFVHTIAQTGCALPTKELPLKCPAILASLPSQSPSIFVLPQPLWWHAWTIGTVQFTFKPQACERQDGLICATTFNVRISSYYHKRMQLFGLELWANCFFNPSRTTRNYSHQLSGTEHVSVVQFPGMG